MTEHERRMQIVGVRFGQRQRELIQGEAKAEGVSESQFIRDAAYARAVLYAARRKDTLPRIMDVLLELSREIGRDELAAELTGLLVEHQA